MTGCVRPGCPEPVRYEWEVSAVTLIGGDGRRMTWPSPRDGDHRALIRICAVHGDELLAGAIVHARPA